MTHPDRTTLWASKENRDYLRGKCVGGQSINDVLDVIRKNRLPNKKHK